MMYALTAPKGDENRVTDCLQRSRNSMQSVLQLDAVPDLEPSDDVHEHMNIQKLVSLYHELLWFLFFFRRTYYCFYGHVHTLHRAHSNIFLVGRFCHFAIVITIFVAKVGEQSFTWALEKNGDRTPLPCWIAEIVELRVCKFVTEHDKWESIIQKREAMGRGLTRTQTMSYNSFLADCDQKLVFNKKKKVYVYDSETLKRNIKDCITFTLHLSSSPADLMISTPGGESFLLVLLKLAGQTIDSGCPQLLDTGASVNDVEAFDENHDDNDAEFCEGEGDMTEAQIMEEEDEKARADGTFEAVDEELHEDHWNILADSDDDIDCLELPVGSTKVKCFDTRTAWTDLQSLNLTEIPRHIRGCTVAYHSTTNQWQGYYPSSREVLSATWGGKSKMSEKECILKVIRNILVSHLQACPKDKMWENQLRRVRDAEATM